MSEQEQPTKASDLQVGGDHYKSMKMQPAQFVHGLNLGYLRGNVIKYVSRHRRKAGKEDIRKALHYVELLKEWGDTDAQIFRTLDNVTKAMIQAATSDFVSQLHPKDGGVVWAIVGGELDMAVAALLEIAKDYDDAEAAKAGPIILVP